MGSTLREETRRLLREAQVRPRRGWGQSFLVHEGIRERILAAAGVTSTDLVLEIGPGVGALTDSLAEKAGSLVAVEIDPHLHRVLQKRFAGHPRVTLHHGDALRCDYTALLGTLVEKRGKAKVVANLPYAQATPIILRLLEQSHLLETLLVMVQREVAARLGAIPGTKAYGPLSIACQYRAAVVHVDEVPAEAFYPRPQVESTLLRLEIRSTPPVGVSDPAFFFQVVRVAFSQRRKTLVNALASGRVGGVDRAAVGEILGAIGISRERRAETLSLEEFGHLSDALRRTCNGQRHNSERRPRHHAKDSHRG